jgi:hypothetical protein
MHDKPQSNRPPEAIKDDLIAAQAKTNHYLGLVGAGFAAEMLADKYIPVGSAWRSPVIFAASLTSLGGIIGDLHHSSAVARLHKELAASTALNQP